MLDEPLVSVVSPSYNQGQYIEYMIRSVVGQTYTNIEHIVIDGGSDDGTIDVLEQYDTYLDYWVSEPDEGPANALNKGFRQANGSILAILNSDDVLLASAVERVVSAFERSPNSDVVAGNGYIIDEENRIKERTYSTSLFVPELYAYDSFFLVQQSTFWTRQAHERTDGFNDNTPVEWDAEFWVNLFLNGAEYTYINDFLSGFRYHGGSITVRDAHSEQRRLLRQRNFEKIHGRKPGVFDRVIIKPVVRYIGKLFPPQKLLRYLPTTPPEQGETIPIPEISH